VARLRVTRGPDLLSEELRVRKLAVVRGRASQKTAFAWAQRNIGGLQAHERRLGWVQGRPYGVEPSDDLLDAAAAAVNPVPLLRQLPVVTPGSRGEG
jgi:hypothetical protein